jgi:tellurite resistance protein TehA-like permease
MCVGPPSFTGQSLHSLSGLSNAKSVSSALAFIGMANGLPNNFDPNGDGMVDAEIIRIFATIAAVFLWALALWWFFVGVVAVISSPPKYFHLGWWAMVFPNTGFILATISIGNQLKNEPILYAANVMSVLLLCTYFFVLYHLVRAVWIQDIMYPGRDEDVEDH